MLGMPPASEAVSFSAAPGVVRPGVSREEGGLMSAGWVERVRRGGALLRSECGRLDGYMGPACFVVLLFLLALWFFFWFVLPAPVWDWLAAFPERAGEPGPVELEMAAAVCVLLGLYYLALAWAWVEEVWGRRRAQGVRKRGLSSS